MSASGEEVCKAQSIIDACKEPLIGLQYVTEFKLQSGDAAPWYVCNLCEIKFTYKTIQSHVVSMKHRINYMRERFMNYHTMIYQHAKTNVQKNSLAAEYAASIEEEEGRQKVRIKISESAAKKRPLEEKDDSHQMSPKIQRVMNAQRESATSQSVSDKTAELMTNEIACSPTLQTASRRINFVGGGPRQGVDSSLQSIGGATTAHCYLISRQNQQTSWLETSQPDLLSSHNITLMTQSSDVRAGSQMSTNCMNPVPLKSCLRSRRCDLASSPETATALPLKAHAAIPSYSGSALTSNHNNLAKVASNSTGNASSVGASTTRDMALESLPVPARYPFAQTVNRTLAESGFVDKPRFASSYSNSRKELIACFNELRSRPLPPCPSASALRGFCRPSGIKLTVPLSMSSSSLPLGKSTLARNKGTSDELLANSRPPLLPLRTPIDSTRLKSRLHLPPAGNSMSVNNRTLPSESSTTVKPLFDYPCTIPKASANSPFDANIGQCRAETANSNITSHSNFSRSSISNSLHNLGSSQLSSNDNSFNKSPSGNIYTECTRPLTNTPRRMDPRLNTGTSRIYNRTSAVTEPVSPSTASNSLACISEKHNSTFTVPAFDSRSVDLDLQEASKPLYRHEEHKKNVSLEDAAIVNHSPASNSSVTRRLVRDQKIEELKPTSSVTQTTSLSKTSIVDSQTKDATHSTQPSMSAISSALAKALVEYQLLKKQKNDTVQ